MKPNRPRVLFGSSDDWREQGLQIASRLNAVLRTGRSYSIGNPVFTSQLEQLLDVLEPALAEGGEAVLHELEGDLAFNELRLPMRSGSQRFHTQLLSEFVTREIVGVRFRAGLDLDELESFMHYFLPSELYKGAELREACEADGVENALPELVLEPRAHESAEAPEAPASYQNALEAGAHALEDARVLLEGEPRLLELRHLQRVVQPLVDSALAGDALSATLGDLGHARFSGWSRGLQVAMLAIGIGRHLGLSRAELAKLGVVALLQHGRDDDEAPYAVRRFLRLARLAPLSPTLLDAMRVALTSAAAGGEACATGEPQSEILAIAERFLGLATEREHGKPCWTPYEALGLVLGPLGELHPPALRAALVRTVGVYPPGQVVRLDDGTLARVCAAHPENPEHPYIEQTTIDETAPTHGVTELPPDRHIVEALPRDRWPTRARRRAA